MANTAAPNGAYSMLYALGLYAVAALLMALAGPSLRHDWVSEAA